MQQDINDKIREVKLAAARSFSLIAWGTAFSPLAGLRHSIRNLSSSEQESILSLVRARYGF